MQQLTQARLKELLNYDPETGIFTRKTTPGGTAKKGNAAGAPHGDGYLSIMVDRKNYLIHRLAWFYIHEYLPEHDIDHLNGIRDDNRICNLREVSRSCNLQNQRIYSNNTSGFPGVCWHKRDKKWTVKIRTRGKRKSLGYYQTALNAALARLTEEIWNPNWTCNHRSELVKAIKAAWPEFNEKSLS